MHSRIMPDIVKNQTICGQLETNTVYEAVCRMAFCDVAAIVVMDDEGILRGIVTERDITRRVVGRGLDPRTTTLGEIMTRDPDTLYPDDLATEALELMRSRSYRHLPVVESNNRVVGMVSIRDLYATVQRSLEEDLHQTEAFVFGERYGAA